MCVCSGNVREISSASLEELDAPLPPPVSPISSTNHRQPGGVDHHSLDLTPTTTQQPQSLDAISNANTDGASSRTGSVANLRHTQQEGEASGHQDYVGICLPVDVAMLYQVGSLRFLTKTFHSGILNTSLSGNLN